MQKDASYHASAIQYNKELAEFAEDLATRLEHDEVARWSRSVAKQHRFHEGRHQKALDKLRQLEDNEVVNTEDGGEDAIIEEEVAVGPVYDDVLPVGVDNDLVEVDTKTIEEQQREFAEAMKSEEA